MLAIGLNPSTADSENLDPTSRNIQAIAENNGCDGWWLINLYPMRTSKPSKLPKNYDKDLADENIDFIKKLLHKNNRITKILLCWGNHIEDHTYLKNQANKIIDLVQKKGIDCFCIGKTMSGNPFHPAPMVINRFFRSTNNIILEKF